MFFSGSSFIGIDPTAGRKPFSYAALDQDLRLISLASGNLEEVLAFTAGQHRAVVAVCAPRRPNQRLMERSDVRDNLNPPPRPGRWTNFRLAEYLLRQHHISCYKTPSDKKACPNWMQMGFHLYKRLEQMGFKPYPATASDLQWLEVYPYACFSTLLGHTPLPKHALDGRLQRQALLYQRKLTVHDPMDFIKGITSQKLLQGSISTSQIYSAGELDALVAAYTAWQAGTHPDQVSSLGDVTEGLVILPVADLKRRY